MNFEASILKIFPEPDKVKAVVSITIDGNYAVHGIKIYESVNRLAVAMPNRKIGEKRFDTFHPINAQARTELVDVILAAYCSAINSANADETTEPTESADLRKTKKTELTENKN